MKPIIRILKALAPLALVLLPLALIFAGTAMISLPAGLVVIGALLWIDLYRKDPKQ